MMKITLILEGYLKYKYPSSIIELNYPKPITISKVLKDANIFSADVFIIKIGASIVKQDYLFTRYSEVKLLPVIGGG